MNKIIKYRAELDGLRAIAVFSVIIYHAKLNFFGYHFLSGGFLGVDIFFVISGYLITFLILKEIKLKKFSLTNFYLRRARRLLPVLFFVILACCFIANFFFYADSLVDFVKSALSSITYISNYYFYYTGQKYDGEDGLLKPLLHTWSLSIEEQFYIIFPLFLILILKIYKKKLLIIFYFL